MTGEVPGASRPAFAWRPQLAASLGALTGLPAEEVVERLFREGDPQTVRIKHLGGGELTVRPATSDIYVLRDTFFGRFHLPPREIEPRVILDLGSNIGTTMAHFAHLHRDALICGVELDEENAALCVRNTARWNDRCRLLHAAVAARNGTAQYEREVGIHRWGFRIGSGSAPARAMSLDSIVEHFGLEKIDYVKMDIEGAECEVLRNPGQWPHRVQSLKMEVHPPYTVDEAAHDLAQLGFSCERDARHKTCVVARRT